MTLRETTNGGVPRSRVRFAAGIALMASSFLVYPAYPFILFLPYSEGVKIAVTVAASLVSWGVFSAGIFLAGRQGYEWLKGRRER